MSILCTWNPCNGNKTSMYMAVTTNFLYLFPKWFWMLFFCCNSYYDTFFVHETNNTMPSFSRRTLNIYSESQWQTAHQKLKATQFAKPNSLNSTLNWAIWFFNAQCKAPYFSLKSHQKDLFSRNILTQN